jgi:hypothetical protein
MEAVFFDVDPSEAAAQRDARDVEIVRLAQRIAFTCGDENKMPLVAELLAVLGAIHNTPEAKFTWEKQ